MAAAGPLVEEVALRQPLDEEGALRQPLVEEVAQQPSRNQARIPAGRWLRKACNAGPLVEEGV
ncbi:hypothetical protein, partial [Nocardioides sp.]|uniref:hypothetical protein n=1 Tax=Nocardioides sp. TaxID=35761 RepID=UPI002735BB0F